MEVSDYIIALLCIIGSFNVLSCLKSLSSFVVQRMTCQRCSHCAMRAHTTGVSTLDDKVSTAEANKTVTKNESQVMPPRPPPSSGLVPFHLRKLPDIWVTMPDSKSLRTECYHLNRDCPEDRGAVHIKRLAMCDCCQMHYSGRIYLDNR